MGLESIDFGAIGRGVRSVQDYDNERVSGQTNRLALLQSQQKMDEYTRSNQERDALRSYLGGGADLGSAQGQQGLYRAAPGLAGGVLKDYSDRLKDAADVGKKNADAKQTGLDTVVKATAFHRDQLAGVNDPQSAAAWVQAGYADPDLAPVFSRGGDVQTALARIPTDAAGFQAWKQQNALGAQKFIEQNKPTYQTRNLGGTTDTLALPGLGGAATVVSSMANSQSPDNAATQTTTMRGQTMMDARQREATATQLLSAREGRAQSAAQFAQRNAGDGQASSTKPLPMGAIKLQQENLDAINTAQGVNRELQRVQDQLASGALNVGLVDNLVSKGRNLTGISSENSRNFSGFETTLERLRNATLLLQKGTQTEGDAQRAFANIGAGKTDSKLIAQQLALIQGYNMQAVEDRKRNIAVIRENFGVAPMQDARPATLKSGADLGGGFKVK